MFEKLPDDQNQMLLSSRIPKEIKHENEDRTKLISDIEFSWKNIYVKPKKVAYSKKKSSKIINIAADIKKKFILENMNGKVTSGEALAILGSSGAGKTTLLNLLSKKIESRNLIIEGEILMNNVRIDGSSLNALSSYVRQDDILESTMTPIEILLFTAKLKLNNMTDIQIEKKVEDMVKKLNLQFAKNTKIGDELKRGISGGERKRTSIGVELISDPQIIFLDEPTTGLDSYNAYEVIENLCTLAREDNRLIIFTIHQPSSEVFNLLDKICILADGKTIYFGPTKNILDFFGNVLKLPCKPFYNPFEHFMEMTSLSCIFRPEVKLQYPELSSSEEDEDEFKFQVYSQHMQTLANLFQNNKIKFSSTLKTDNNNIELNSEDKDNESRIVGFSDELKNVIAAKKSSKGFWFEYLSLLGRNVMRTHRNLKYLYFKIFQNFFLAIIQCFLYYQLQQNYSGIQDRLGLLFISITSIIIASTVTSVFIFADERKIYERERSNKLYSVQAYFFAKISTELPILFITANCLITPIYILTNLNDTFSYKFYITHGIVQLSSLAGFSFSIFLGAIVSDQQMLTSFTIVSIIIQMLVCGYFASSENFLFYIKPLEYISLFKYAFQILVESEFESIQPLNCFNNPKLPCNPLNGVVKYNESSLESFIALLSLTLGLTFIALMIMIFKGRDKK